MKDDRVMTEILANDLTVGSQIIINDVMLVGTRDYTAIGRPSVSKAKVYATVEEISRTDKVIIFKKQRRKGY